jgi:hypothetical protein
MVKKIVHFMILVCLGLVAYKSDSIPLTVTNNSNNPLLVKYNTNCGQKEIILEAQEDMELEDVQMEDKIQVKKNLLWYNIPLEKAFLLAKNPRADLGFFDRNRTLLVITPGHPWIPGCSSSIHIVVAD